MLSKIKNSVNKIADLSSAQPAKKVINRKQFFIIFIKCAISIILIYWILRGTNIKEIFRAMHQANIPFTLSAFCLYSASYYFRAHRWRLLLKSQGVDVSIPFLIKSYMISIFFGNFLPSTIGADAVRIYDSWKAGTNKLNAVGVIFMDRFLGMLALMIFVLIALWIPNRIIPNLPFLTLWVVLVIIGILVVFGMVFIPIRLVSQLIKKIQRLFPNKAREVTDKMLRAFQVFQNQKVVLGRALGLSLIFQTGVVIHYYLLACALDFHVPFHCFFLIVPLSIFIMMLPVSINAIGIREHVFIFFFTAFDVSKSEIIAFAWLAYGIVVLLGLIGGFIFVLRR